MKKLSLAFLIFSLAVACATVKPEPAPAGSVRVEENTGIYRFGNAFEGEIIQATFVVCNPSPFYLSIEEVETSCGCTTVDIPDTDLPPDGQILVYVELNTTRLWGPQSKSVTLHTNSPYRPRIKLLMEGVVRERLSVDPRRIQTTTANETFRAQVSLVNNSPEDLFIVSLQAQPDSLIQVRLRDRSLPHRLAPNVKETLLVEVTLARAEARVEGTITIHLQNQNVPVKIPVDVIRRAATNRE